MLRSFAKAAEYIYIDQAKMAETKQWVVEKQQDDGCFQMVGSLFHKGMKVGQFLSLSGLNGHILVTKGGSRLFVRRAACLMKSPSLLTSRLASWR